MRGVKHRAKHDKSKMSKKKSLLPPALDIINIFAWISVPLVLDSPGPKAGTRSAALVHGTQ